MGGEIGAREQGSEVARRPLPMVRLEAIPQMRLLREAMHFRETGKEQPQLLPMRFAAGDPDAGFDAQDDSLIWAKLPIPARCAIGR